MRCALVAGFLLLSAGSAFAQGNLLDQGRQLLQQSAPSSSGSGLTNQQADSGLREALKVATQKTVAQNPQNTVPGSVNQSNHATS